MTLIRPRSVDILKLALSPEQGFVLSRVDHPMTIGELAAQSGIDEDRLGSIVAHLAQQGAVELEPPLAAPPPPPAPAPGPPVAGIVVEVRGITDVGMSRSNNEDAFTVADANAGREINVADSAKRLTLVDSRLLLAVSDGMGGENAGEVASALVLESLREHLSANVDDVDPADALANAVHHANTRVTEAASEPGRTGMGATLVAVIIDGTTAVTAEIGDSRLYLLRDGVLGQLSKDQTHLEILRQQGLLTEDLMKSRAKNIVLQACGKAESLIVAQRRLALANGDRLLLCSDGLTLHVEDAEIQTVLATPNMSTFTACETLVKMANDRGGKDNVTVLIADVANGGATPADGDPIEVLREYSVGDEA